MASGDKLKKKRISQLSRSLQKEETERKLDDLSGSDNEDIDFSREIRPIGYYINDREKMIEEMFSVIKNDKLRKMLPPILKSYSLEEIKADCLVHLLGMSKKRIYATLQGRDLNSSSDSETDSTNSVLGSDSSQEPQITSSTHLKSDVEEIDDTLDITVSKNDLDSLISDKKTQSSTSKKRADKSKSQEKPAKKIKSERSPSLIEISDEEIVIKKKKKKEEKRSKKKAETKAKPKHKHPKEKSKKAKSESSSESSGKEDTTEDGSVLVDSKKGKSLLEILELEMRARAIRALLEANPSALESTSKVKQDPERKQNQSPEKVNISTDDQNAENIDESDSFDVEVINDDEVAIIILDDVDEQIDLESDNASKLGEKEPPKSDPSEKEPSKKISLDKEPSKESLPEKESLNNNSSEKEHSKNNSSEKEPSKKNSSNTKSLPSNLPTRKTAKNGSTEKELENKDIVKKEDSQNDLPSNPSTSDADLTWPQRWAESKGVKEIIQNSKLCANIRKRMRFARMLKQKQEEQQQQQQQQKSQEEIQPENLLISELKRVEEGSVDQLQLLKLLDETKKSDELNKRLTESEFKNTNSPESTVASPSNDKEEGEIDDDEGSELVGQSNDCHASSVSILDIDVPDENTSCLIDITDDD